MPIVDKYNLYSDFVLNEEKYPKSILTQGRLLRELQLLFQTKVVKLNLMSNYLKNINGSKRSYRSPIFPAQNIGVA